VNANFSLFSLNGKSAVPFLQPQQAGNRLTSECRRQKVSRSRADVGIELLPVGFRSSGYPRMAENREIPSNEHLSIPI
jgi:hypothetical protein